VSSPPPETPEPRRKDARRRADKRQRLVVQLLPVLGGGAVLLLLVCSVLSVAILLQQRRSTEAIRGGCARLQDVRDELNVQAWVQYRVIAISQGTRTSGQQRRVARLLSLVDADTRNLLLALLESGGQAAELYPRILETTRYLPPNDCRDAVDNPGHYRTPAGVPFRLVVGCFDPRINRRPPVPCPPTRPHDASAGR
jgi:hypothetical protein